MGSMIYKEIKKNLHYGKVFLSLKTQCTYVGEYSPELGYQMAGASGQPLISQRVEFFTEIQCNNSFVT